MRVIAASNRDLQSAVAEGSFREDLFYRLRVFDIYMPPLRERRSDIPLLTDAFLQDFNRSSGCASGDLTPEAFEMMERYEWPGNVRELHNALERAAILCEGGPITAEHLSLQPSELRGETATDRAVGCRAPNDRASAPECDGNKSKAARKLGITRTQLYGRLRKHAVSARNSDANWH